MKNNKILHNIHQELTNDEKVMARENIGIIRLIIDNSPTMSDGIFQKLISNFGDTIITKGSGSIGSLYYPTKQDSNGYHFSRVNYDNKSVSILTVDYDKNITVEEVTLGSTPNYITVNATNDDNPRFIVPAHKKWIGTATFILRLASEKLEASEANTFLRSPIDGTVVGSKVYVSGSLGSYHTISVGIYFDNTTDIDQPLQLSHNNTSSNDIESITFTGVEV